jgi:CubicO group peptidase (beta-lactamase class C family)
MLRHLLTHTAGFRDAWRAWLPCPPPRELVELLCRAPQEPGWVAGETSGYNVAGAWTVLAAILERIDGRRYRDYVREEIFLPLGMQDCWIGMDDATFASYGDRIRQMPFWEGHRGFARSHLRQHVLRPRPRTGVEFGPPQPPLLVVRDAASDRAFSYQDYFSSVVFADPEHALAVALVFAGVRDDALHTARVVEAHDSDLGL